MSKRLNRSDRLRAYVRRVWPWLLYRLCISCRKEFRREWGWVVMGKGVVAVNGGLQVGLVRKYVCRECATDETEALRIRDRDWSEGS